MCAVLEVARFRADDCEALVLASLACPTCLRGATVSWTLGDEGYDPYAECDCAACGERWRVYLDPWQALRLALLASGPGPSPLTPTG